MIKIEEVLEKEIDIKSFDELEGFDENLNRALGHFIGKTFCSDLDYTVSRSIRNAWQKLEKKQQLILEEHFGKKNIVFLGTLIVKLRIADETTRIRLGIGMGMPEVPADILDKLKELFKDNTSN